MYEDLQVRAVEALETIAREAGQIRKLFQKMVGEKPAEKHILTEEPGYLETVGDIILDNRFWDCECEENYIHPKSEEECKVCGAYSEGQPDSRMNEVIDAIFDGHIHITDIKKTA